MDGWIDFDVKKLSWDVCRQREVGALKATAASVGVLHAKEEEANIPMQPNNTSADVRITVGTFWLASTTMSSIPAKKQNKKKRKKNVSLYSSGWIEIFLFVWYLDPMAAANLKKYELSG